MSNKARQLMDALQRLMPNTGYVPAVVKQVHDDRTCTCVLPATNAELYDVQLQATTGGTDGWLLVPAADSVVMLERIGNSFAVAMTSQVTKLVSKVGTTELEQEALGFTIKKGDASLKAVLQLIIEAVQVIVVPAPGTQPNQVKLTQALAQLNQLMKA